VNGFALSEGSPAPLGVHHDGAGVNVAVFSANADAIFFCVFDADDNEVARLPLPARTGDVFHAHVGGVSPGTRYGLRAAGPWDPARGHRFNVTKLLVDPFATRLDRPFRLHPSLIDGEALNAADSARFVPKAIVEAADSAVVAHRRFDWDRQIIYELHVRGFTMRHPEIPEQQRGTFAGLAHPAAIAHLRRLGVTTVELMPAAAWIDERHLPALGLSNYWGYNPVAFLAPDPRPAPGGWHEVAAAVRALHDADINVVLDVVLNHTGEGDDLGPTLSLRGLDNASYYRLPREERARFINDTGCGNTLACDHPFVLGLAMEALRTWTLRTGIDGFRLDLATTLGRRAEGFDPAAPLFAAIAQDPVLSQRIFIAEPWDVGPGGYQFGAFPAGWGEWNGRYRDAARRFWRGDGGMLGELVTRLAGSADVFAGRHRPLTRSVNFVTAHDGFTLADLVAFAGQHNEANGEGNRDGTGDNLSWNTGIEGATDDPAIVAARARDVRALLATLLLSRGTPMLSMGDECGRTQGGNNNAYAQDNPISWLEWERADAALVEFTSRLTRARLDYPALTGGRPLTGHAIDATGIPDVTWFLPNGRAVAQDDWQRADNRTLVAALYAAGSRAAVVLHAGAQPIDVTLPPPRIGYRWRCAIDSASDRDERTAAPFAVAARSVVLLVEEAGEAVRRGPDEALDTLARAAGIALTWWDLGGREHRVADDTKRALLAAMCLPAATAREIADSLAHLAARAAAPLSPARVFRAGEPIVVPLGPAVPSAWLTLAREDGETMRVNIPTDGARQLTLPSLPSGRHRLLFDGHTGSACHLAVVPARCYLPPDLAAGQRRFGIAAQLYALWRERDQGIGDFTTLAQLAARAGKHGAAVIGLNPLHALFTTDRTRASPYQPSHREFLDPIYIDIDALPGADAPARSYSHSKTIDYARCWGTKQRILTDAFAAGAADDPAFEAFIAAGGTALKRFAIFDAIAETQGNSHWQSWPEPFLHPDDPAVANFAAEQAVKVRFHCFQQFIAERQLTAAAQVARAAGVTFYRDLAVGSAPDGAEAWSRQDALMQGVSIGAPPDPFSAEGQVWSLPPPDPFAIAREGYAGFSALLAANMRHAGALRIDHVMGLERLFIVPDGASARDGAYVAYPRADLLGLLALESERAKCAVVGEDLGTVPAGLREVLAEANVLSYRVLWFERDDSEFRPPARWPARAAACVSTHDLPTLAGWWMGADIAERQSLGMLDAAAAQAARAERSQDKATLVARVRAEKLIAAADLEGAMTPALAAAVHALIAKTPALLSLVQADDLAGETVAINLPGTVHERENWRRRLRGDLGSLFDNDGARAILAAMLAAGRANP
jgi:glycogen operon protein